jgi:hypothetical protein
MSDLRNAGRNDQETMGRYTLSMIVIHQGTSEMKTRITYYLAAAALLLSIAGSIGVITTAIEHGGSAALAAEANTSDKFARESGNGNNEVTGLLCAGTDAGGYD